MKLEDTVAGHLTRALRKQSMRSLARELDVDVSIISKWLAGKQSPSLETLNRAYNWAGLKIVLKP